MSTIGVVLLAAGGSSRMGRPKQLLSFGHGTLLRHGAEQALATGWRPVVVVLGNEAEACALEIADLDVTPVVHAEWHAGMGSSLRAGVTALEKIEPSLDAVLILLHDQPFVSPDRLRQLAALLDPPRIRIACAHYEGAVGVPALFDRSLFDELKNLPPGEGAKNLLRKHAARLARLEMPEAALDIDTRGDYAQARSRLSAP